MTPPTPAPRSVAIAALHTALEYFQDVRGYWSKNPPTQPGRYWLRYERYSWPQMIEVSIDYGESELPLVVRERPPEDSGVEYLKSK